MRKFDELRGCRPLAWAGVVVLTLAAPAAAQPDGQEAITDEQRQQVLPLAQLVDQAMEGDVPGLGEAGSVTVLVDPAGKYLYLTRYPEQQPRPVHAFSIDQTTGALTAVGTYSLP